MDDVEIPEYFICPISLQIMRDPVTAITGITYDRDSIEHWLFKGKNTTCPVTKQPLPIDSDLTPNHTLRRLIQSWCTENASNGVVRIPTPKAPLSKSHVLKLVKEIWVPLLQLKTLRKLELLAMENDRNRRYMVEAGVVKTMLSFLVCCFNNQQTAGLEEALSILYLVRAPSSETRPLLMENNRILESFTWILRCKLDDHTSIKVYALLVLKAIVETASSHLLERLNQELFASVVGVLREGISHQGINAALTIMLTACPWGRNRISMVEAGAVFEVIEIELGMPERRTTELILGILFHLCTCADGRAQFLSHSCGIAVVAKRILRVSVAADDRAVLILSLVSKFCGTCWVLQEMMDVEAVTKLCLVLQADYAPYLKEKAREILRSHHDFWKHSPCFTSSPLSKIHLR